MRIITSLEWTSLILVGSNTDMNLNKVFLFRLISRSLLPSKKMLPPGGVQWLFPRAQIRKILSGRLDAEILVLDEKLELVAISHQINRMVPGLGFTRKPNKL